MMKFNESSQDIPNMPTTMFNYIYHSDLIENLIEQERRFGESHLGGKNRIALFDLDNTLLDGDIGDAVFAQLLLDGFSLPLSWKDYRSKCKENPRFAYVDAVRALNGISMEHIIRISKRLLQSSQDYLTCEGEAVRIPKPNLLMKEVVRVLRHWYYSVFIVSSSNDISAKVAGSVLFDIPVSNIAGIKPNLLGAKFTNAILEPIPVGVGKVAQYRLMSGDYMPMVVATDNVLDIPLLQICDPDGTAIIVGENEDLYVKAREELSQTVHIYRVPSDLSVLFQQQHRVA